MIRHDGTEEVPPTASADIVPTGRILECRGCLYIGRISTVVFRFTDRPLEVDLCYDCIQALGHDFINMKNRR